MSGESPVSAMSSKQPNSADLIDAPDLVSTARSGRVVWDERGNSLWEWQTAPGVFSREISSQQLEALEASDLKVVDAEHLSVRPLTGRLHTGQRPSQKRANGGTKTNLKRAIEKLLVRLGLPA